MGDLQRRAKLIVAQAFGDDNSPTETENAFIKALFEEFSFDGYNRKNKKRRYMDKQGCQEALYKYLRKAEQDLYSQSFRGLGLLDGLAPQVGAYHPLHDKDIQQTKVAFEEGFHENYKEEEKMLELKEFKFECENLL